MARNIKNNHLKSWLYVVNCFDQILCTIDVYFLKLIPVLPTFTHNKRKGPISLLGNNSGCLFFAKRATFEATPGRRKLVIILPKVEANSESLKLFNQAT